MQTVFIEEHQTLTKALIFSDVIALNITHAHVHREIDRVKFDILLLNYQLIEVKPWSINPVIQYTNINGCMHGCTL